jgi:hypothetical protein
VAGAGEIGVRVAGLPATAIEELRCPDTAGCVEEILALEDRLDTEAQAVCAALYELIGDDPVPGLKSRLVGLRRAIHAGRRPTTHLVDDDVQRVLAPELADRIRCWATRLDRRDALARRLPDLLRADVDTAAAALRATVSGPTMRLGLVYSQPAIFRDAQHWVARSGGRPADKVAVRLARYVSRAAAKTSPLTTFTASGLGEWRDGGPALALCDRPPHSAVEFDLAALHRVIVGLATRPVTAGHMLVRVNPTATVDGDQVRFIAPGAAGTARAVRRTPAVEALLHRVPAGTTRAQLRDQLAGAVADPAHAARADEFADRLLRAGLLELHLPIADQALHPRAVLAWLDGPARDLSADPEVAWLRAVLGRIADLLDAYAASADATQRLGYRERIDIAARDLAVRGNPTPTFYENAVLPGVCLTADTGQWAATMDDLAAVTEFGRLYDPGLPARLMLPTYVAERYGPGATVPFLSFYAAWEAELRDGSRPADRFVAAADLDPAQLWTRSGQAGVAAQDLTASPILDLVRLGELRRAASALLRRAPVGAETTVAIAPDELRRAAAGCPGGPSQAGQPLSCYVQPYIADGQNRLVLNSVRFGLGTGRTRIRRLVRAAHGPGAVPEKSPTAPPDGPLYVEVESAFGSSLNQRDPAVDLVLAYPGTVSARPERCRVPLGELRVVHDPAAWRVRLEWTRTGREVQPVHLGLLAVPMLPPAVRFLVGAFSAASYLFTPSLLAWSEVAGAPPPDLRSWPRLRAGGVTLRRAGWWVPSALVPRRATGQTDAAYLLDLARWRRRAGLPERCFVRAAASGWQADAALLGKERKPMYVDFASWHLVRVFERMVGAGDVDVTIEEALPDLADLPRTGSGERRVVELIVEVPGRP